MWKVMIADDEIYIREGIEKLIPWQSLGCELVYAASNGKELLDRFRTELPDIVIVDIRMPLIDGLEVARTIDEEGLGIPVILLTAYADFQYAHAAIKYKVSDYIVKTAALEELPPAIERAKRTLEERHLDSYQVIAMTGVEGKQQDTVLRLMESSFEEMESRLFHTGAAALGILLIRRRGISEIEILQDFEKLKSYCGSFLKEGTEVGISPCFINVNETEVMFERVLSELGQAAQEQPEQTQNHLIGQMREYIRAHYCEHISLEDIAGALHANKSYLSRLYKHKTGENLSDTILAMRIEKAKELIESGEKKIYEIADAVGIEEAAYFSRIFKKATGMSPRDYYISCQGDRKEAWKR